MWFGFTVNKVGVEGGSGKHMGTFGIMPMMFSRSHEIRLRKIYLVCLSYCTNFDLIMEGISKS